MILPRSWRRMMVAVVAVGVAATAAGCSTANPGSAAVVGDAEIPESRIAEQVRELNEAAGQPATQPDAAVARSLVNYGIVYELVEQAAAEAGVSIRPGAVDKAYADIVRNAGGEEQLIQLAIQQGIPVSGIRRDIEVQLIAAELAAVLVPGQQQQLQQQVLVEALGDYSDSVGVEVAPKYGQWDTAALQIGPPADPVSRPAATAAPEIPVGLPPQ